MEYPFFAIILWFGFFVLWHINICRLFNVKAILLEVVVLFNPYLGGYGAPYLSQGYLPESERIRATGLRTRYYDSAVHRFNHYTTRTSPIILWSIITRNDSTYLGPIMELRRILFCYHFVSLVVVVVVGLWSLFGYLTHLFFLPCAVTWVLTARLTSPKIKTLKTSLSQQVFLFNGKSKNWKR